MNKMKPLFRILGYAFLFVGSSLAAIVFISAIATYEPEFVEIRCMKGKLVVPAPRDGGIIDAGEIEICGTDLDVSAVYGPNMATHIEQLREENAVLRMQLDSCQEKQSL
jgi:hypothetical protein